MGSLFQIKRSNYSKADLQKYVIILDGCRYFQDCFHLSRLQCMLSSFFWMTIFVWPEQTSSFHSSFFLGEKKIQKVSQRNYQEMKPVRISHFKEIQLSTSKWLLLNLLFYHVFTYSVAKWVRCIFGELVTSVFLRRIMYGINTKPMKSF